MSTITKEPSLSIADAAIQARMKKFVERKCTEDVVVCLYCMFCGRRHYIKQGDVVECCGMLLDSNICYVIE